MGTDAMTMSVSEGMPRPNPNPNSMIVPISMPALQSALMVVRMRTAAVMIDIAIMTVRRGPIALPSGGAMAEASTIAPALGRIRRPASSGLLPCTI